MPSTRSFNENAGGEEDFLPLLETLLRQQREMRLKMQIQEKEMRESIVTQKVEIEEKMRLHKEESDRSIWKLTEEKDQSADSKVAASSSSNVASANTSSTTHSYPSNSRSLPPTYGRKEDFVDNDEVELNKIDNQVRRMSSLPTGRLSRGMPPPIDESGRIVPYENKHQGKNIRPTWQYDLEGGMEGQSYAHRDFSAREGESEGDDEDGNSSVSTESIVNTNKEVQILKKQADFIDVENDRKDNLLEGTQEELQILKSTVEEIAEMKNNEAMLKRYSIFRNLVGSSVSNKGNDVLVGDTFTLMMMADICSVSWILGVLAFFFQTTLGIVIAFDDILTSNNFLILDVPFKVSNIVRTGQFFSIVLCVLIQSDILSSIRTFVLFGIGSDWNITVGVRGGRSIFNWIIRIVTPNIMKLFQGILMVLLSFLVIVQGDDIIDLLKNFTALMVISQIDVIMFHLATHGYLGGNLKEQTQKATKANAAIIKRQNTNESFIFRSIIVTALFLSMIGGWVFIMVNQLNGTYFAQKYPLCENENNEPYFHLAKKHFGTGGCWGGPLNSIDCAFEGGDCINFNLAYPLCQDSKFKDVEARVGDGICDEEFSTSACNYDGGDCCPLEIIDSPLFGDGQCNIGENINSKKCGYDNGDCVNFIQMHPNCPLEELAGFDDDETVLGNGFCDGGLYTSLSCGFKNGDCDVGQIGQDITFHGAKKNNPEGGGLAMDVAMSSNGMALAVGSPVGDGSLSQGLVNVYGYDAIRKIWISKGDIVSEQSGDLFGYSISVNRNGMRIAVGAPNNFSSSHSGMVKVFDFDNSKDEWVQIGSITGFAANRDGFGYNIDLIDDGSRLAIAAPLSRKTGGYIRVYIYDATEKVWIQVGSDIKGKEPGESIGVRNLHLDSSTGSRVIFTSRSDQNAATRIYEFNQGTRKWMQLGNDILNMNPGSCSISADGKRVAISSNTSSSDIPGQVQVFNFRNDIKTWEQTTESIYSQIPYNGDGFGRSVVLSSDGNLLAIGSIDQDCSVTLTCATGAVELFVFVADFGFLAVPSLESSSPSTVNRNRMEERERDRFNSIYGWQVSMSADRSLLLVAGYNFGSDSSFVKVFKLDELFDTASSILFELRTDDRSSEISWTLLDEISNTVVDYGPANEQEYQANTLYVFLWSLARCSPYTFYINDSYGNGLLPPAQFRIFVEGVWVKGESDGMTFSDHDTVKINHCPSNKSQPTASPSTEDPKSLPVMDIGWKLVGEDIDASAYGNLAGHAVAINRDGSRAALGAFNSINGTGYIQVFEYDTSLSSWKQIGKDVEELLPSDQSGLYISMSDDGNRISVDVKGHENSETSVSRVFSFNNNDKVWSQLGQVIDSVAMGSVTRNSVKISGDGNRLAVNEVHTGSNSTSSITIYEFDSIVSEWVQLGQTIDNSRTSFLRTDLALNKDGTKVLLMNEFLLTNGKDRWGTISVYGFTDNSQWAQMGNSFRETGMISVDMSAKGDIIIIGSSRVNGVGKGRYTGLTRVYQYVDGVWTQLGSDVDGISGEESSRNAVSISGDGYRIIVGSPESNYYEHDDIGEVQVFHYNKMSEGWDQIGRSIHGECENDMFGKAVGISTDGRRIIVGGPNNNSNSTGSGHVRIFEATLGYKESVGSLNCFTFAPSHIPSTSQSPSIKMTGLPTNPPTSKESAVSVIFELSTDIYPSETSWKLTEDATGDVIKQGPNEEETYELQTLYTHEWSLKQCASYTFTIYDSGDNGLWWGTPDGYFRIYVNGKLVKGSQDEEAFFGTSDTVKIKNCVSPSPTTHPTVTLMPSHVPSLSYRPSLSALPSLSPTTKESAVNVILEIMTDFSAFETSWTLTVDDTGDILHQGPSEEEPYEIFDSYFYEWSLKKCVSYTFTIYDSFGDGLVGYTNFESYFMIEVEGERVMGSSDGSTFGYEDIVSIYVC